MGGFCSKREKATEILFETLASPAMHMALEPVLALYACNESSGLVVDIGDSGTQVTMEAILNKSYGERFAEMGDICGA